MQKKWNARMIAYLGILLAVEVVLSRFLSINAWNMKFGFSFVPIVVAAMMFGPVPAAVLYGLADVIGATLFPSGAFFPGFTFSVVLTGFVFGILIHKKQTWQRILLAVVIHQFVISLFLNSYWLSMLYGTPYQGLLEARIVQSLITAPIQFVIMFLLAKSFPNWGKGLHI